MTNSNTSHHHDSKHDKSHEVVAPFLRSLRKMLDDESDTIVRWTPNGRAFEILDLLRMSDVVLPKYFKHRKYTSFQRQLNYFSFRKWTKSKAVVCTFSNELFLRDQPELAWRITRKRSAPVANNNNSVKTSPRAGHASCGDASSPASPTTTATCIGAAQHFSARHESNNNHVGSTLCGRETGSIYIHSYSHPMASSRPHRLPQLYHSYANTAADGIKEEASGETVRPSSKWNNEPYMAASRESRMPHARR